jgi:hypothetical protein
MRHDRGRIPVLDAVQRFIFAPEDARRLAAMRIGLFGLLAFRMAITDFQAVANQPAALFDPVSVFEPLTAMPSSELTSVLQMLAVLAALAAAAGVYPRLTFPAAFTLALFLELMLNATGKIIHNDAVLMLCLLPLVASPRAACRVWAPSRALGAQPIRPVVGEAYGWPIRTAMIVIALAYLFVGLQKLRYSGVDWVTSENLRWVLYAASDSQRDPNELALFVADRAWLAHVLAAGTIALEVGFLLCLRYVRLRWVFVPGVVSLHLGIGLMMNLDYSAQALAVIIVFVNWAMLADLIEARRRRQLATQVASP